MKNYKNIIFFVIPVFILVIVVGICCFWQDKDSINSVKFVLNVNDEMQEGVSLFESDGVYYAFLPSYTDLNNTNIKSDKGYKIFVNDSEYKQNTTCGELKTDTEYKISLTNLFGIKVVEEKLIIMKSANIPSLSIKLSNGTIEDINADKEVSKKGIIQIIKEDKTVDYSGSFKALHGRGNSTWSQNKKSYTLQFSQAYDLLGMGSGENWVLLSNSFDESGLRNKLAYDVAKELGVKYAVDSEYVDLYIDNVYYGLYLLAEKIEVGENRVNITNLENETQEVNVAPLSTYPQYKAEMNGKVLRGFDIPNNPKDISGGYLVQIEHHVDRIENKESLFQTDDLSFSVSSPKYSSREQIQYLSNRFQKCENAIKEDDLSMLDVDSFVIYYLVQELFANNDNCSVFYYKDVDSFSNKIYACSIWDFDLSVGNGWRTANMNPQVLYRNTGNWFNYLYNNKQFRSLLVEKYTNDVKTNMQKTVYERAVEYGQKIRCSFDMDKIRWEHSNSTIQNPWADESQNRFYSIDEHINYIVSFMQSRIKFLDSVWIDGEQFYSVKFSSSEDIVPYIKTYSVPVNSEFNEIPIPEPDLTKRYVFVGWFDEEGNKYVPGRTIMQDESYFAKWEKIGGEELAEDAPLSLIGRIKQFVSKNRYLILGWGVILIGIMAFVIFDFRQVIKSRRYRNGRKH